MTRNKFAIALLGASAFAALGAAQAFAQGAEPEAVVSDAPAPDEATTNNEFLQAQVESLQAQIDGLKKQMATAQPTWKGAPQWVDSDSGFSFKVRGRFQYDTAFITHPDNLTSNFAAANGFSAISPRNLGFNSRVRRVRLGVEGTLPSDFGYKFEADFANAAVGFGDAILTYNPKGKPWSVAMGNQESLDGLEQITSSRFISFMERAAFNDAFNNTRRLGINLGFVDSSNVFRLNVGGFTFHSIDSTFNNDGWIAAARAVYAPQAFGGQLHFGANYQHREYSSQGSTNNYQARPFQQTTDVRFVQTGTFSVKSDDIIGAEAIGIFGPLHLTAEGQYLRAKTFKNGTILDPLDQAAAGTLRPNGSSEFWGGYAEIGYFFTGETRGYKNGQWDRTKVLHPLGPDGWGALQANLRVDYLELNDKSLRNAGTMNYATGIFTPPTAGQLAVNLTRGGEQIGYQGSLIWIPQDYVRFILQYVHTNITGGPIAAIVDPTSTKSADKRSYGVDSVGLRAQFDF